MAFAGVSLIADGELCASTASPIDARADRGYHLLVVEGYSRSKDTAPTGEHIKSRPFLVGGHRWRLEYYPNGYEEYNDEFISVRLVLDDDDDDDHVEGEGQLKVEAQVVLSFIDQPELRVPARVRRTRTVHRSYEQRDFIRRDVLEGSRHLKDDSFIIRCDIHVLLEADSSGTADSFVDMMQSHLGSLLLSDEGADITFKAGGETFPAHRCVLASRSSVFKEQLFFGGGTASTMTKENIIEIDDMEAEIFYALLVFIYTDSFPNWDQLEEEEGEEEEESKEEEEEGGVGHEYATWLLQLLEAADRYNLQRLKSICAEVLVEYIGVDNVADAIVVAERRECPCLKDACLKIIKSNTSLCTVLTADSLDQIIRTCSPSVLHELISKFIS